MAQEGKFRWVIEAERTTRSAWPGIEKGKRRLRDRNSDWAGSECTGHRRGGREGNEKELWVLFGYEKEAVGASVALAIGRGGPAWETLGSGMRVG
ncbi:hypothetical protein HPP92_005701 [Vanilla planifolia]|uniref:Uncharacterized protein n=1 Tax=Vanilla planifolia TaxID=51239 RepID=A0A835RUE4_VANPL|nr:hypothetical protein HPP92_005701 [Vanilla planifolia]